MQNLVLFIYFIFNIFKLFTISCIKKSWTKCFHFMAVILRFSRSYRFRTYDTLFFDKKRGDLFMPEGNEGEA